MLSANGIWDWAIRQGNKTGTQSERAISCCVLDRMTGFMASHADRGERNSVEHVRRKPQNLIGGIVLGYIWQILINCVLSIVGQPLLALNSQAGYWGLIILTAWQQIGYMMIIYIAGLQNVPDDLIEAAAIDGANAWQTFWKVKLPMIMSSITVCVFLTLTNSFKLFDQNLALTAGDPAHSTEMLALNIYQTFYSRAGMQWKGYGQAKAVLFCILVVVISFAQLRATRSKEVQR